MQKTKIEYLDYTWNITHGCSPISEGCTHCWAESMSKRLAGMGVKGYDPKNPFRPTFCSWKLTEPQKIKKPSLVGVSFMGDLFHEDISHNDRNSVFEYMDLADWHSYLLLTKRPDIALDFDRWRDENWLGYPHSPWKKHIWLGVTVELEKYLWRVKELLKIPAAVKFISIEPMLGSMDIYKYLSPLYKDKDGLFNAQSVRPRIDWIIIGGESSPNARPMHPDWPRSVRDQCQETGIPFFFKQWGGMHKKAAGRLLDGQEWNEYPEL